MSTTARHQLEHQVRLLLEDSEKALEDATEKLEKAKRIFAHVTGGKPAASCPLPSCGFEAFERVVKRSARVDVLTMVVFFEEQPSERYPDGS